MFRTFVLSALAASTFAAPGAWHEKPSNNKHVLSVDQTLITSNCSLAHVSMNLGNISLPPPPSGQKLLYVAVGRGIQNYTCNPPSPDSAPTAVGAIATLYNAGCLAAYQPAVFDVVPDIVLQFSLPTEISADPPSPSAILSNFNTNILGHHYFLNASTPVFDLNTPYARFGKVIAEKVNAVNAPAGSPSGQASNTNGAVQWLFLEAEAGTTGNVRSVYRTHTAGGNPPSTCSGMPAAFSVEYAAKYWFLG
ncbi:hypothetical protein VTN77DRAFT_2182 [Rasamsonia byssochlamydoides]|uniref:uncharacterized protein n=1 Tax=Rasamsonia byssochlamydoides TaxID=89139 RepID=UPI003742FDD8